jgi:hypothetical protein
VIPAGEQGAIAARFRSQMLGFVDIISKTGDNRRTMRPLYLQSKPSRILTARRTIVPVAMAASLLTFACAASAQDQPHGIKRTGLELGARVPFAFPIGEAQRNVDLSDVIAWQVPFQLDVGYREERVTFGLYFGYGFGNPGQPVEATCDAPGVSCRAHSIRAGIQLLYHFAPKKPIGGWISGGVGYEKIGLGASVENADAQSSGSYMGVEFASVQGGIDFRSKSGFGLGPFMGLLPGRYLDVSLECSGRDCPASPGGVSIGETTFHYWIVIGVRGALLL